MSATTRILVADDDPASRKLLEKALQLWGYRAIVVGDGDQAVEALGALDPPSLAILDWEMPALSGVDVCRAVRAQKRSHYVYVLLLTGRDSHEDVLDGLEAGADDYLTKPVDLRELRLRLRAGRRIIDLQAELAAARDALEHRATHDALTGVMNRAGALERLEQEISRAQREGPGLAAVLLDVDHFKRINDTHGHPTGDDVLHEMARRIPSCLRPYDVVGRYGGEEFLIVIPGADADDAMAVAERVRTALASAPFSTRSGEIAVTASLGIATFAPGTLDSAEALVARADKALYHAKRTGRNRVHLLPSTLPPRSLRRAPRALSDRVFERLRELLGEDAHDEMASLVDEYVACAMRELRAMRRAAHAGDLAAMRRHAHALRGASANFGVENVAALAGEVERATAPPPSAFDRLDALVVEVEKELRPGP